jgi:ABC-2 type transport system permease protein
VVRDLLALKARLTWNGIRHDRQRRIGFPVATLLLGVAGWYLATKFVETSRHLDTEPLSQFLGWGALLFFAAWITLPVVIFPLDENLDPQQLATLPVSRSQIVVGLTAASFVAPATVVPLLLMGTNTVVLAGGWWMVIPASLVYMALLAVGSQLFSATISAILRTRRGRDIATFLILGIAAGSFFVYSSI